MATYLKPYSIIKFLIIIVVKWNKSIRSEPKAQCLFNQNTAILEQPKRGASYFENPCLLLKLPFT